MDPRILAAFGLGGGGGGAPQMESRQQDMMGAADPGMGGGGLAALIRALGAQRGRAIMGGRSGMPGAAGAAIAGGGGGGLGSGLPAPLQPGSGSMPPGNAMPMPLPSPMGDTGAAGWGNAPAGPPSMMPSMPGRPAMIGGVDNGRQPLSSMVRRRMHGGGGY